MYTVLIFGAYYRPKECEMRVPVQAMKFHKAIRLCAGFDVAPRWWRKGDLFDIVEKYCLSHNCAPHPREYLPSTDFYKSRVELRNALDVEKRVHGQGSMRMLSSDDTATSVILRYSSFDYRSYKESQLSRQLLGVTNNETQGLEPDKNDDYWVMKLPGGSLSHGIALFDSRLSALDFAVTSQVNEAVLQEYEMRPLLIGDKKIALRSFALVLSTRPMVAYWIEGPIFRA